MLIRPAQRRDADDIARVHVMAAQAGYRGLVSDAILDALDVAKRTVEWRSAIAKMPNDRCLYVAVEAEVVIGFAGGGPARKDSEAGLGELYVMSVEPHVWRRGAGSSLQATVVDWLAERFEVAVLWVLADNIRARRFYESCGWTCDGEERKDEFYEATAIRYRQDLRSVRSPLSLR